MSLENHPHFHAVNFSVEVMKAIRRLNPDLRICINKVYEESIRNVPDDFEPPSIDDLIDDFCGNVVQDRGSKEIPSDDFVEFTLAIEECLESALTKGK